MSHLEELESAIVKIHGCHAAPAGTVAVGESFRGRTVWEGEAAEFELAGCPMAKRCYAWGLPDEVGALEITSVLEIPPVCSAEVAVRVAIASRPRGDLSG